MKRIRWFFIILCFLLFTVLTFLFVHNQKPDIENISHHLEMSNNNTFFIAENKQFLNLLYEVDENGTIISLYKRSNNLYRNKEIITDICYENDLYFLVQRDMGVNDRQYEIIRLSAGLKSEESLGIIEKDISFIINNFTVSENKIYITGLDSVSFEQIVYGLDLRKENSEFEVELLQKVPVKANGSNGNIIENFYDGTNLYSLTNQGMLYRYQKNSALGEYMNEPGTVSWIFDAHSGVLCYSQKQEAVLHINQDKINTIDKVPEKGIVDMTISLLTGDQAVIYRDQELNKRISCYVEEKNYEIQKFSYEIKIFIQLYIWGIGIIGGVILSFLLLILLILYTLEKQRKTALTMAVLAFFLNVSFITAVCTWNYLTSKNSLYDSRAISTNVYLFEEIERLKDKVVIDEIDFDSFSQSEWFYLADNALWDWIIEDYNGNEILFELELLSLAEKENKVLVSKQNASGRDMRGIYSKELLRFIKEKEEKEEFFWDQRKSSFEDEEYMYVMLRENENYMWLAKANIRDVPERTKIIWIKSVQMGIVFGSVASFLFMWLIFRLLRPLKKMSKAMEKVSIGIYDLPEEKYPDNEFGDMWRYLHKMCNALRVKEHSSDNVLSYYQRFAPKNFENLLGAESIQDVKTGDRNKIEGSLALISIIDPIELHEEQKRHDFLQAADKIMNYLNEEGKNSEGVLLAEGYRFTSFRKLYQEPYSAQKAYSFAVELVHELYSLKKEDNIINPCIILHNDNFQCGLMGSNSMVCPYIISEGTEILSSFLKRFNQMGVRLVITGEMAEKLTIKPLLRFIGHLSKENKSYHLYEVLNVCPKTEMLLKTNHNGLFQQGLLYFFENEFYKARNCFSEMVKICPSDGVAKWYLFASEDNQNDL